MKQSVLMILTQTKGDEKICVFFADTSRPEVKCHPNIDVTERLTRSGQVPVCHTANRLVMSFYSLNPFNPCTILFVQYCL